MKKIILVLLCAFSLLPFSSSLFASGNSVHLDDADIDVGDKESLQRGAKYFVNYCIGCHTLKFSRYNRVAKDIGLTDKQITENMIFTTDAAGDPTKVGNLMLHSMDHADAEAWFGILPPDLSLVARARGADWVYTYLRSFYKDEKGPLGVNNTVFPDVGMPHVLWELQGMPEKVTEEGKTKLVIKKAGTMSPEVYDDVVRDITNFLVYVSEPIQIHRKTYGVYVLLFLLAFFVVAYMLKKEFWKDVH